MHAEVHVISTHWCRIYLSCRSVRQLLHLAQVHTLLHEVVGGRPDERCTLRLRHLTKLVQSRLHGLPQWLSNINLYHLRPTVDRSSLGTDLYDGLAAGHLVVMYSLSVDRVGQVDYFIDNTMHA